MFLSSQDDAYSVDNLYAIHKLVDFLFYRQVDTWIMSR